MRKPTRDSSTSLPVPMPLKAFARDWKTSGKAARAPRASSSPSSKPSMAYLVNIAARAQRDMVSLYEHINAKESTSARRWYQGLGQAILSLEESPNRCPATPESKKVRHLLYGHKPHVYRV